MRKAKDTQGVKQSNHEERCDDTTMPEPRKKTSKSPSAIENELLREENLLLRQKLAELEHRHELLKSEHQDKLEKIKKLYLHAPVGLCMLDRELRYIRINEYLAHLNGIPAADHIGKNFREIMPGLASHVEPILRKVLETGIPVIGIDLSDEAASPLSEKRSALGTFSPVIDDDSSIAGIAIVVHETTELKKVQRDLAKINESLKEAQRLAHIGSWSWDVAHDTVSWSEELYAIVGRDPVLPAPNFQGHKALMTPGSWELNVKNIERTLKTGEPFDAELELVMPDKMSKFIISRGAAERGEDGNVKRIYGTIQDITDRKAAEKELQNYHTHLEELVTERTLELEKANWELQTEISERRRMEQALTASEERFRVVADNAAEWIWEVDVEGLYTYSSSAVEKILGYSPEELTGKKHFYDLFSPERYESLRQGALSAFKDKKPFKNFINPNIHKHGMTVILETSGTPMLDEEGNLRGYCGADVDITERKRAEEALRESEERLRLAIEATQAGVWDFDLTTNIASVTSQCYTMLGYEYLELPPASDTWKSLLHPDDLPGIETGIRAYLSTGARYSVEIRLKSKSGEWHWLLVHGMVIRRDDQGNPLRMIGTCVDIHQRKKTEEELQKFKEHLEELVEERTAELKFKNALLSAQQETSIDGILVVDGERRILSYNRRFIEMWGISAEIIETSSSEKVVQAILDKLRDPLEFSEKLNYLYSHPREKSNDELFLADGRIFERYSSPLLGADGIYYGRIWYFRDVTRRKKDEQTLKRNEAQFRQIIDLVPHMMFVKNWDGKFVMLNRAHEKHYGMSVEGLVGKYHADIHRDPEEVRRMLQLDRDVMSTGETKTVPEQVFTNNQGERRILCVTKVPFYTIAGNERAVLGLAIDITEQKEAETALKESEAQLKEAQHIAHIGSWNWDISTDTVSWSEELYHIIGLNSNLLAPGRAEHEQLLTPSSWERYRTIIERTATTGGSFEAELEFYRFGNEQRWIVSRGMAVRGDDGRVIRMHGTVQDITEQKQADEALRKSEANLTAIMESTKDLIWTVDAETFALLTMNNAYKKIIKEKCDIEALPGMHMGERLPPDFAATWKQIYEDVLSKGSLQVEIPFPGSETAHLMSANLLLRDGKPYAISVIGKDITERRKAEEAIRESEAYLSAIMDSTDDMIWCVDSEQFRLLSFNKAYKQLFEAESNVIMERGMAINQRLTPQFAEIWKNIYRQTLVEGKLQTELKTPKGTKTLLLSANSLLHKGKPYAISLLGKDITRRKKDEESLQRAYNVLEINHRQLELTSRELKEAFAEKNKELTERRRIEHELHLLTERLESVREDERTAIAREIHDELGQNITTLKFNVLNLQTNYSLNNESFNEILNSMVELLNSMIFTVQRISSELRPRVLDDLGLIEALKWLAHEFHKRTGIECSYRFSHKKFTLDRKISTTLFRICQEALTNVARHSKASAVSIAARLKENHMELKVKDNGIGISYEESSAPLSFGIKGIKERVHLLGGEVKIAGSKNKGTSIEVTLSLIPKGE